MDWCNCDGVDMVGRPVKRSHTNQEHSDCRRLSATRLLCFWLQASHVKGQILPGLASSTFISPILIVPFLAPQPRILTHC